MTMGPASVSPVLRVLREGRLREIEREENAIVCLILACAVLLPFEALSSLRLPMYALLLVLDMFLLLVTNADPRVKSPSKAIFGLGIALVCYLMCCWVANGGNASERLIQALLALFTLLALSRYEWDGQRIKKLRTLFAVILTASAVYWAASGMVTNYYSAFYGHGNGFANVVLCALCVELFALACRGAGKITLFDWGYLALCLALLAFANSRSAIFAAATLVACTLVLIVVGKRRPASRLAVILFVLAFVAVLAFSVLYPSLYGTQLGYQLEMLSREYLNKNFFSGREIVWSAVLGAIEGNELFGLGLTMEPSMIYDTGFSSHNLYLQTMLQSGVVGLTLVVTLLFAILRELEHYRSPVACVGISLIVALLVHECFEVTLTQNNFSFGVMYWVLFAVALSACRVEKTGYHVS